MSACAIPSTWSRRSNIDVATEPLWQKYGTLAQMAQAAVALLGFVAILFQINEIRTNNRAASARRRFWATPIWRSRIRNSR